MSPENEKKLREDVNALKKMIEQFRSLNQRSDPVEYEKDEEQEEDCADESDFDGFDESDFD